MFFEVDDYNAMKAALRRMCASFAEDAVPENVVFGCKLVANELLSNALRYGGGRASFFVEKENGEIVIRVRSANAFCPPAQSVCSDVTAECGRGLYLVDAFSASRTYSERDGIRVVIRIADES